MRHEVEPHLSAELGAEIEEEEEQVSTARAPFSTRHAP
jgi:hypothetical protein